MIPRQSGRASIIQPACPGIPRLGSAGLHYRRSPLTVDGQRPGTVMLAMGEGAWPRPICGSRPMGPFPNEKPLELRTKTDSDSPGGASAFLVAHASVPWGLPTAPTQHQLVPSGDRPARTGRPQVSAARRRADSGHPMPHY